ncbi:MAG: hypothetical protein IKK34_12510 [Clostridia bacterium]|nr:hypothetical protein [Clostridia bacterium]
MLLTFMRKYSKPLALLSALLLLFAAPYLTPENPDSAIFRRGALGTLVVLACYFPASLALSKHTLRQLVYGLAFALFFSAALGIGSELHIYEKLLPGTGSMLRRLAVPFMAAPLLGTLFSYGFAFDSTLLAAKKHAPWLAFFLLFSFCYGLVLLAFYPGIINYDFTSEYHQFMTGVYEAKHPVFHTILSGALYQLGILLFGSQTAGAATYSVVQIVLLAAMYATAFRFIARRIPGFATLILALLVALLPFQGILAISTIKDALFTGLCVLLCVQLWSIAEDADAFFSSKLQMLGFLMICLFMALLRHNGIFAYLPAFVALIALGRSHRRRALMLSVVTVALCILLPRGLEAAVDAQESPSSELMSIPCQQLMRAAEYGDVSEEEYAQINAWFANITYRYRPHYADTAKGNLDMERYNANPSEFWAMYFKFAKRNPTVYIEAFLENCAGIWYPDDISHAHTMDSEHWDPVYLKTGNILPDELSDVQAHSYLPWLKTLLFGSTHHARHEQYPLFSLMMRPAFYVYLLLFSILYLFCRKEKRWALCLLPICGIAVSLLFSACILVRYGYPIMTAAPIMFSLIFFAGRKA